MLENFDWAALIDDITRLGAAALLGGAVGLERELNGHFAGMRTHMMVAIGAAVFTLAGVLLAEGQADPISRVIQGVAAGIGFIGAGTILKIDEKEKIKGLTTAGSIWLSAALGTVAGLGEYALAGAAAFVGIVVLGVLRPLEKLVATWFASDGQHKRTDTPIDMDE